MITSLIRLPNQRRVVVRLESLIDGTPNRFCAQLYGDPNFEPGIVDWIYCFSIPELKAALVNLLTPAFFKRQAT